MRKKVAKKVQRKYSVKRKIKDSVFTCLFGDVEYVTRLYNDLHPGCKPVSSEDVEIATLRTVLVNAIYNDLGFIVRHNGVDKLVVLVEAQSTWNRHMPLRLLHYISDTYKKYEKAKGIDVYSDSLDTIPEPEFFVIFTGDRKNIPDVISLGSVYWGAEFRDNLNLKVKILFGASNETIYGEYAGFCNVIKEQTKDTNKIDSEFLGEVIDTCIKKGYLAEFLSQKREEIMRMTYYWDSEEEALKIYVDNCVKEAVKKAVEESEEAAKKKLMESEKKLKESEKKLKESEEAAKKKLISKSIQLVRSKLLSEEEASKLCEISIKEFRAMLMDND